MARKKGGHHGGAWKVAYADFVTAMMALFMVLWISSQDKKILLATSRYFQQPFHTPFDDHSGIMPFNKELRDGSGGSQDSENSAGKGKTSAAADARQIELNFLNSVAADFKKLLRLDENLDQPPVDVQVTSDGLRVTLFDRARRPLFVGDTTDFTRWGRFVMQNLAWLIDRHHFRVMIDGHTRSSLSLGRENYTAWELSADRANASRRSLVGYAVDPSAIDRVAGYGDTKPAAGEPADSDANERITISLSLASKAEPGASGPAPARSAATAARNRPADSTAEAVASIPFQPPSP